MLEGPLIASFVVPLLLVPLLLRPWRTAEQGLRVPAAWLHGAAALILVASYLATHFAISGWPGLPPSEATHGLFWFALASVLLIGCESRPRARSIALLRGLAFGGLSGLFLWTALQPYREWHWLDSNAPLRIFILFAAWGFYFALTTELGRRRSQGLVLPAVLFTVLSTAAVTLGLSGSVVLAHLAAACAPALAMFCVASLWRPERAFSAALMVPVAIVLPGLVLTGALYSETPWSAGLLLGVAPLAALFERGGKGPVRVALVPVALALLLGGAAVFLAWPRGESPDSPDSSGYESYIDDD